MFARVGSSLDDYHRVAWFRRIVLASWCTSQTDVALGSSAGWGLAGAASLMMGGFIASRITLPERVAAPITAFGGGVLLATVALELVPEADKQAGLGVTAVGMLLGTGVFVGADAWLSRDPSTETMRRCATRCSRWPGGDAVGSGGGGPGESIAAGIFVDGVPESSRAWVDGGRPEMSVWRCWSASWSATWSRRTRPCGQSSPAATRTRYAVGVIAAIGIALAGATELDSTLLADTSPTLIGGAEAVAAGAVLAVVSIAIIPYTFAEVSRLVASPS